MYYKLTRKDGTTHDGCQWGEGIFHKATGKGTEPCSNGVIHCYSDPLLAVLLNPIHANIPEGNLALWEYALKGKAGSDNLKCWSKGGTTLRQVDVPVFTREQRVVFAIFCAKAAPNWTGKDKWNVWADKWLSGKAEAAGAAWAAARAARAAAWAARAAAWAAARAARAAAEAAAEAAWATEAAAEAAAGAAARAAARAAEAAAGAAASLDLAAIARQAIEWGDPPLAATIIVSQRVKRQ